MESTYYLTLATSINLYNHLLQWLRGPDEREPDGEDLTDPHPLEMPHCQFLQMATTMTLQAGLPAEEPVEDPGVPEVSLEDTVSNLENLVEFLREYQQLQEPARTIPENFYMDRQLVLHQADQQGDRQDDSDDCASNDQGSSNYLNRDVYFTPRGECWHLSRCGEISLHFVWQTCMPRLCSHP